MEPPPVAVVSHHGGLAQDLEEAPLVRDLGDDDADQEGSGAAHIGEPYLFVDPTSRPVLDVAARPGDLLLFLDLWPFNKSPNGSSSCSRCKSIDFPEVHSQFSFPVRMPQYKFVAVEGGTGKPAKLTKSIRSHSIRTALRNSGNSAQQPTIKAAASRIHISDQSNDETKSRRRESRDAAAAKLLTVENGAPTELLAPLLPTRIGSVDDGSLDPFDSLPVSPSLQVNYLVKYLLTKFNFNAATADPKRHWLPYAMRSAAMMHSTLAMAAVLWRAENAALDKSLQLEGMRQKYEAICEVRAQLPKHVGLEREHNDLAPLMSTMSTLVFVEIYDGNFETAELHLQGVRTLFNSHHRRNNLEADFIFCKSTILADIEVAIIRGRQLMFPTLHTSQASPPVLTLNSSENQSFDNSITESDSKAVADIFTRLRQALLARKSPEAQYSLLHDADCRILRYLSKERDVPSDVIKRTHALLLAAHVFMYATLRHVPSKSTLMRRMVTRLHHTVEESLAAGSIWVGKKPALMWVALVGMLGTGLSETGQEGQWFLSLFKYAACADSCANYAVCNRDIRKIFSTFLWDEAYCQPVLAAALERLQRTDPPDSLSSGLGNMFEEYASHC
ncbi:hypothetical protein PG991_000133 [Apiospora marii]|uniref:Uncharacterized protein n=1 Tax=Apiospora marii TaxID=335849 RepID=A0ABR1T184_9PEZI